MTEQEQEARARAYRWRERRKWHQFCNQLEELAKQWLADGNRADSDALVDRVVFMRAQDGSPGGA